MKITLLKLGGSLITDKSKAYALREKFIKQVSEEIFRAKSKNPDLNLIIGSGAGSFAHYSAKKYNTSNGVKNLNEIYGASIVHFDAQRLNQIVVENLLAQKISAFPIHPSTFIFSTNKKIESIDSSFFIEYLNRGFTPITYGDVILDTKIGATILSTDTIFRLLAIDLLEKGNKINVIHAGDYNGVMDKNNKTIPEINSTNIKLIHSLTSAKSIDVTGGMRKKVEEMLELAKKGIKSQIVNGTKENLVFETLLGLKNGTLIK